MKFTRKDYVMHKRCTHREYYAQFVDERTRQYVLQRIGRDRLVRSTDPHLNDIPLIMWDRIAPGAPGSAKFKEADDHYTLAGGVCLLKEAAKQIIEERG